MPGLLLHRVAAEPLALAVRTARAQLSDEDISDSEEAGETEGETETDVRVSLAHVCARSCLCGGDCEHVCINV